MKSSRHLLILSVLGLAALSSAQEATPVPPQIFPMPVDAADAFIKAAKTGETEALLKVFGDKHKDLAATDEPARDRELRGRAAAMAEERRRFRFNDENSVTMVIGAEAWPFPIPIVKAGEGWQFDTDAGIHEIVKRRIGENELTVIPLMSAYFDAQFAYAGKSRDDSGVLKFARKFHSSPGKHDGLYWPAETGDGAEPSPAGPEIKDSGEAHAGYHFKILTAQGEAAPAGKYDYLVNGHFIGGFALVAWPAQYGKTGIMSFIVNHYGIVSESDLGPDTAKIAAAMTEYNPTGDWQPVSK
jgi:hypothetical protein